MSMQTEAESQSSGVAPIKYDPYDFEIDADPYPVWKRMRDEAPLYRNEQYKFWALSRYDDVAAGLRDFKTYSSSKGTILEMIANNATVPPGLMIFEDPPMHTVHRNIMSRLFTPRRMAELEPKIRQFCAASLDPLVGTGGFNFIRDLGSQMPMRVIGMLLGVPEEDQEELRDGIDAALSLTEAKPEGGKPKFAKGMFDMGRLKQYIDWRRQHPSEDLMTELLNARFVDEKGVERTLHDMELLMYVGLLAGAGNETTTRLIGWTGYTLSKFPDQRRILVEDRSLVPNAIEEILRYEAPSPVQARCVTQDVEHYGTVVKAGDIMLLVNGAANRDEREFENPDQLDVRREKVHHASFGHGLHFCLGASLARLEGRIALEEVLSRFPDWEVDHENVQMARTSTVRGWKSLPVKV